MSGIATCSGGFVEPDSGAFPNGYCVMQVQDAAVIPIVDRCNPGYVCPCDVIGFEIADIFDGECFAMACVPEASCPSGGFLPPSSVGPEYGTEAGE